MTISDASVSEGGKAMFIVTLTPMSGRDVTIQWTTGDDPAPNATQATANADYAARTAAATLTVATSDDSVNEPSGSVTVAVKGGTGYTVSPSNSAATVAVSDDDVPEISVSAGSGVTEGEDTTFTITGSPAPHAALPVSVSVTQSGDYGVATGSQTVTIPTGGSYTMTVTTTDDSADEADGSVTVTIDVGDGYTVSSSGAAATVAVSDDDDASSPPSCAPNLPADAVTVDEVTGWRDEHSAATHQARWNRVLAALGEDTGESPMTAEQAQEIKSQIDNSRWDRTARTLEAIERCDDSPPDPAPTPEISIAAGSSVTEGGDATFTITASPAPASDLTVNVSVIQSGDYGVATGSQTVTIPTGGSYTLTVTTTDDSADEADGSVTVTIDVGDGYTVSSSGGAATVAVSDNDDASPPPSCTPNLPADAVTVDEVTGWRDEHSAATHQSRWNRVLAALGEDTGESPMTAEQAQEIKSQIDNSRWDRTARTLEAIERCADSPPDPAPTPEISIAAGSSVTEGGDATFTITASPAPASALSVSVTVSQSGDYGVATGSQTVTIPTGGGYTLTVTTTDDNADEADGSVTVTIDVGDGYTVSSSDGAATVAVSDDDDASPPPPCTPNLPADAVTVDEVTGWRDEHSAATHQSRWNRVLAALGEDTGESPMTAEQAQEIKSQIDNSRWDRTARTLEAIERCAT